MERDYPCTSPKRSSRLWRSSEFTNGKRLGVSHVVQMLAISWIWLGSFRLPFSRKLSGLRYLHGSHYGGDAITDLRRAAFLVALPNRQRQEIKDENKTFRPRAARRCHAFRGTRSGKPPCLYRPGLTDPGLDAPDIIYPVPFAVVPPPGGAYVAPPVQYVPPPVVEYVPPPVVEYEPGPAIVVGE